MSVVCKLRHCQAIRGVFAFSFAFAEVESQLRTSSRFAKHQRPSINGHLRGCGAAISTSKRKLESLQDDIFLGRRPERGIASFPGCWAVVSSSSDSSSKKHGYRLRAAWCAHKAHHVDRWCWAFALPDGSADCPTSDQTAGKPGCACRSGELLELIK
ncbi:hypothetical protein BCR34DRAFT_48121 [Clohesyomyces aquaticus]|uniref:Uncharacterized protein n=1 Tax=Clohesyomyces aquaticus TaxID=1231657 RepID=A0A1Y1Z4V8_9PLEO|nr:hypothetical protein BCR34DRAFT_48121 [Clohesyomyces aquaticus]